MSFCLSMRRLLVLAALSSVAALLGACAGPPLTVYTLEAPTVGSDTAPSSGKIGVVEVRRVLIPDALDTQDIVVRSGSTLARSSRGRWASRFSLSATYFLTRLLAQRRPELLVTDQPQIEPPNYRLVITIDVLDVTANGTATLEADWLVMPRDAARPSLRQRARFSATGPVATDQDVVSLNMAVLKQLADAIAASTPW
ncbi:PqiC family protein [Reyranella sp.]|uniref:PqiC family protein n=1 Tax=Reyranella sp. TaxID=1929291 RepID=UPI003D0AC381